MVSETLTDFVICHLGLLACDELAQIDLECNRPPWSSNSFRLELKNENVWILGLRHAGSLHGFIVIKSVLDEAHIMNFGVLLRSRGKGFGSALLKSAIVEMGRAGIKKIFLEVRRSNVGARNLYSGNGFIEAGIRNGYYVEGLEDAITMVSYLP